MKSVQSHFDKTYPLGYLLTFYNLSPTLDNRQEDGNEIQPIFLYLIKYGQILNLVLMLLYELLHYQ